MTRDNGNHMDGKESLIEQLRAIAGRTHVLVDREDLAGYQSDGRGKDGGIPFAVIRPSSADEVSALVRWAAETGMPIVVQGGQTGLAGAGLASNEGQMLASACPRSMRLRQNMACFSP